MDADGIIWHISHAALSANLLGRPAVSSSTNPDWLARLRYHTVLHILNTVTLRDYGGWITGVQMANLCADDSSWRLSLRPCVLSWKKRSTPW